MGKKIYSNSPEYYVVILYISLIVLLTSAGLIYSCIHKSSYNYIAVGIVGLIWGVIGFIEFVSKKRIFPHRVNHTIREIIALVVLALGVYILRTGSLSASLNWREKMVCIILFAIGFHALHLRSYIRVEEKKE